MTVASFPRSLLLSRTPKISLMRLAVSRESPISQLRSKILWMGKWRLKMKFRQYSICAMLSYFPAQKSDLGFGPRGYYESPDKFSLVPLERRGRSISQGFKVRRGRG